MSFQKTFPANFKAKQRQRVVFIGAQFNNLCTKKNQFCQWDVGWSVRLSATGCRLELLEQEEGGQQQQGRRSGSPAPLLVLPPLLTQGTAPPPPSRLTLLLSRVESLVRGGPVTEKGGGDFLQSLNH